ncbi:hypothetical protein MTR67_031633 [Solanum verrucosum]|uniref:Uncharacterized protein n=1 Tax=Solanum verrucosum TaxID=315347 RepID=A0AAF0U2U6_SOLVR|nr:hypothetical protein MTR67_031633 [Solanum verrucosum]
MISSQVQGPGPLQNMLVQDHSYTPGKLAASKDGEVVRVLHQPEGTRSWFYSLEQGGFHVKLCVPSLLSVLICFLSL